MAHEVDNIYSLVPDRLSSLTPDLLTMTTHGWRARQEGRV